MSNLGLVKNFLRCFLQVLLAVYSLFSTMSNVRRLNSFVPTQTSALALVNTPLSAFPVTKGIDKHVYLFEPGTQRANETRAQNGSRNDDAAWLRRILCLCHQYRRPQQQHESSHQHALIIMTRRHTGRVTITANCRPSVCLRLWEHSYLCP